jgi:hypothetical protein
MSTNTSSGISLTHHTADGAQVIPLEPGIYRVGTGSDCALILDDPSVSEAHCEIEVAMDRVVVRDLGSAGGTSIEGVPILEEVLGPGQRLQVGTVEFSYPHKPAPEARPGMPIGSATVAAAARRRSGPRKVSEDMNFGAQLREAFAYPFRRDGMILLICGTIVFTLFEIANLVLSTLRFAGIFGLAYLIVLAMGGGYLFAFMQAIITSSAQGDTDMPPWPEISDFVGDILGPFFRLLAILLVCAGPGLVLMTIHPAIGIGVLLLGLFCLPMALLTVAMADSLSGLNPIVIFSGIAKVPARYLCICAVFMVVLAVQRGGEVVLAYSPIPLLPTVVAIFFSLYGLAVEMRLLGLLYHTNRERFAWFQ